MYILYYIFYTLLSTEYADIVIYTECTFYPYLGQCSIFLRQHDLCVNSLIIATCISRNILEYLLYT
jgi:hypothetical protein